VTNEFITDHITDHITEPDLFEMGARRSSAMQRREAAGQAA
jgi:hypothetical protein